MKRGSMFIGVSVNNKGWQISFKYHNELVYLGFVPDLHMAATVYDLVQIQIKGIGARTNYDYNKAQVVSILFLPNLVEICKSCQSKQHWY